MPPLENACIEKVKDLTKNIDHIDLHSIYHFEQIKLTEFQRTSRLNFPKYCLADPTKNRTTSDISIFLNTLNLRKYIFYMPKKFPDSFIFSYSF